MDESHIASDSAVCNLIVIRELPAPNKPKLAGPVYVSFDVDVLDPAFAPGVSHREPGGMSVREAISHLHAITGNIVGADLVEYNPKQDVSQLTATVSAKILKEILAKVIAGSPATAAGRRKNAAHGASRG
jgi:arginase